MLPRRSLVAAAALATLVGCEPSIPPPNGSTAPVNYVVFDPSTAQIPQPNDLSWLQAPTGAPKTAQDELLQMFAAQQGFPNDQAVPIAIDVQQWTQGTSDVVKSAPAAGLEPATLTPSTFVFMEQKRNADGTYATPTPVAVHPEDISSATGADRRTITIRNGTPAANGSRRWNAGSKYFLILRGGANGAKLAGGAELTSMPTMYLLTRGVDLSKPENQYLLPGTRDERMALGIQLELLRQQYLPLFAAVEETPPAGFGWGAGASKEIVSIQTFTIAPVRGTQVVADESAGVIPLPSDFLLDPVTGKVVNNPAFGPLAAGIATLDGFSTTAMILAQTSGPVAVEKINKDTVFLYELAKTGPVRVKELFEGAGAGFVAEPLVLGKTLAGDACTTAATCFSTAIGLQPATIAQPPGAPLALPPTTLPPLKDATEYAVIITKDVLAVNAAGTPPLSPLEPTTLGRILLFSNALVDANGHSQIPGQSDATAAGLEQMRQGVAAAAAALSSEKQIGKDRIAMAYTFRTQTITDTGLQLAAAPYQNPAAFVPGTPADVSAAFPALPGVRQVLSVPIPTLNPIDMTTGALNPDPSKWTPAVLNALVVVPTASPVACPAPNQALKCAPLVVFAHGLGRSKSDVAAIASTLASAGFVVAAIDAPLHGDRAYCTADAECACPTGATGCTPKCGFFGPAGLQGDAVQIGFCAPPSTALPVVSGRFAVTGNFFRTRDAFRQMVLDTSALVLALAPPSPSLNALVQELAAGGVAVDGRHVEWVGQSLGGLMGTIILAVDPRFSRGVLDVPGATVADILTTSPAFAPQFNALLAAPPTSIAAGTPEYLQFVQILKLILDAGEPLNFARHIIGDASHPTLPDLLQQQPSQAPKNVFGQYAQCDQTVPNLQNLLLLDQIGLAPTPVASGTNGYTAYNVSGETFPGCTAASAGAHGFLLTSTAATAAGQGDVAAYLLNLTLPTKAVQP